MRIFLIGWAGKEIGLIGVMKEIKKYHEIIYWSASDLNDEEKKDFPGTIFHDYQDATWAKPAPGIDTADFLPLDEDFITKFYETESEVLTMMNKKFEWMGVSERKQLYYNFLQYWKGIIGKYRPDLIIFPLPPHVNYDFVIYRLAKFFGIPTILLDKPITGSRLLFMNDYKEGSRLLKEEMRNFGSKKMVLADLEEDLRSYFLEHFNSEKIASPWYLIENISKHTGFAHWLSTITKMIMASLRDGTFFQKAAAYVYKKIKLNIKDEYAKIQQEPDLNKKFIYIALHYQPECATSPMGGVFVDQILMIKILSAALPPDWVIYVKEHPYQWFPRGTNFTSYRYKGYYESISKIQNVFIVPMRINGYRLIEKCQAVATVTGSSGWEGIMRLKPAIVFGYPWYQNCPGVFKVNSVDSCRTALEKISTGQVPIDSQMIINYLDAFGRVATRGFLDFYSQSQSSISIKENQDAISTALLKEIEKLKR